jgi:glycosyltransferase involved in cell wall biosynthesis
MSKVLHLLAQRPLLTGSGITLDAMVRQAKAAGWQQRVAVGVPGDDAHPRVGGLDPPNIHPLYFEQGDLDFPVPGMSDVMPYRSTRFSSMSEDQLHRYRSAWKRHIKSLVDTFKPGVIYAHHVWIMSSLIKEAAPNTPTVVRCHATGLRQMKLCPHLAEEVRTGCARCDAFVVLHKGHAEELTRMLGVPEDRIHVSGAGYRDELFHAEGRAEDSAKRLIYIGKYSAAKGLPWLIEAFERLKARHPDLELHVAGSGAGRESAAIEQRMQALSPGVRMHGQLEQAALANLMRQCSVCVLPSFYEGVPLVLVEALACGCRLVATELPGVMDQLVPHLGTALERVALPRLEGPDTPMKEDLPLFVDRLESAIEKALSRGPIIDPAALEPFTWRAVFRRVEKVWQMVSG